MVTLMVSNQKTRRGQGHEKNNYEDGQNNCHLHQRMFGFCYSGNLANTKPFKVII